MKTGCDTLTPLYPGEDSETVRTGRPFMTHNICKCGNGCIVVASQYGLIRVDSAGQATVMHEGERIYNVSVSDNNIYALSDNRLYIDSPDGTTKRVVELGFSAHVHHKVGRTHYFIDGGHVVLSENLTDFVPVQLRRKVPQFCGNVITTNGREGFTLMLTDNALWRIPHHTGVFNVTGEILASCTDGSDMYYVNSANEIYLQSANDSVATKIYDLPGGETVNTLMAAGGSLFYISNQRKLVRLNIQSTYMQNELIATAETVYDAPTKITASYAKETEEGYKIYVGIHDELICIDENGRANTVRCMSGKYITAFYSVPDSRTIYISTLNKGVFCGCDNDFRLINNTKDNHFIRDIAVTSEHIPLMMMLTNHNLVLHDTQDTTEVKGFNRLLYVNDTLFYAMPEYGIQRYVINNGRAVCVKESFSDIRFNPNASFVLDGKIYLGSGIGVLRIDPYDENNTRWIIFDSDVPDIRMALIISGFVLLLVLLAFVAYRRRKAAHRRMIRIQIDDLHKRLDGLSSVIGLGDVSDDKVNVEGLKRELETLDVASKDIGMQITALSEKIMRTNRNIGIKLSKYLNRQIEQISHFEAYEMPTLIEESREAEATDNTEHIISQVVKNEKWLELITQEMECLDEYRRNIAGTITIEGLNDKFAEQLEELADSVRHKKLSELTDDIRQLDALYRHLFSRDALQKAEQYIIARRDKMAEVMEHDEVVDALIGYIDRQVAGMGAKDRIEMLRDLRLTDCRISQMLIRRDIAGKMSEYMELREAVVSENEKRVVKKFDTKLEIEIADHTSFVTESIERLIARFYQYMEETDKEMMGTVLKFNNISGQSPKVLALLIADPKVKRVCLPGMLGMFGNMNPVISRLMNNRLKPGQEQLREYAERHPESMIGYILKLME